MNSLIKPVPARDMTQAHRASTPLELLFDLVSVIAIAVASAGLHHAISADHAVEGLTRFGLAFFAIWWAWMNYTWYASAYDNDDFAFRILTMVIMGGSLVLAAGIQPLFDRFDLGLVVAGYVIMRVAMAVLRLRAASGDPERKTTNLTYAWGILLVQGYWIVMLLVGASQPQLLLPMVLAGVAAELLVPVVAERSGPTPWHRHHIIERYGLLTIIVLGEILLGGVLSLQGAFAGSVDIALVQTAASALVVTFAMWWLYFSAEDHIGSSELNHALLWGYGHFLIFGAGAAVGAGFLVLVDILTGKSQLPMAMGTLSVAVPLAVYVLGLWFVRDRFQLSGSPKWALPVLAISLVGLPFVIPALEVIAVVFVLIVCVRVNGSRRVARQNQSLAGQA